MLAELRMQAEASCRARGHRMKWHPPMHSESRSIQSASCLDCEKDVQINTKPQPNGIDIGGPAVALNCEQAEQHDDECLCDVCFGWSGITPS